MIFPSIPADSLYKFLSIGGLVMAIFFSILLRENSANQFVHYNSMDSLNRESAKFKKVLELRNDALKNSLERQKVVIDSLETVLFLDSIKAISGILVEKPKFSNQVRSVDSLFQENDKIDSMSSVFQKTSEILLHRYESLKDDNDLFRILAIVGFVLMSIGMSFWIPQQLKQDKIMKMQFQLTQIELNQKQLTPKVKYVRYSKTKRS